MTEQILIQNKTCTKCQIEKPITEFSQSERYKGGYTTWCKSCVSITAKTCRQANKEHYDNVVKQYHEEHKEALREYSKNYYKNNPEVRQRAKQYRESHKEQLKEYANKWAQLPENKEKRRLTKQNWDRKHRLDPFHRVSNNIRTNMYHALKGKKGFRKWESLVGYTLQDLINHLQPKLTPEMTWDNYGTLWQVDHITPKSWFKYDTAEHPEFKKCWALENLQPKLKIDNIKKGNRFIG